MIFVWILLGLAIICVFSLRQTICMVLACLAAIFIGAIFFAVAMAVSPSQGGWFPGLEHLAWAAILAALLSPVFWLLISYKLIPRNYCATISLKARLWTSGACLLLSVLIFISFYAYCGVNFLIDMGCYQTATKIMRSGVVPDAEYEDLLAAHTPADKQVYLAQSRLMARKNRWSSPKYYLQVGYILYKLTQQPDKAPLKEALSYLQTDYLPEGMGEIWGSILDLIPTDYFIVPLLLEAGLNPDISGPYGDSYDHDSQPPISLIDLLQLRHDHAGVKAVIEAGGEWPRSGVAGWEFLSLLIADDQVGILKELWRQDADLYTAKAGRSLLHVAAETAASKCLEFLLDNGFDPNTLDDEGRTPLMYNFYELGAPAIPWIAAKKVPAAYDDYQRDPLLLAMCCHQGQEYEIPWIVAGRRHLHFYSNDLKSEWPQGEEVRLRLKVADQLAEAGAGLDVCDKHGRSLWHYAAAPTKTKFNRYEIVKALLAAGFSPLAKDGDGLTPYELGLKCFEEKDGTGQEHEQAILLMLQP